MTPAYHDGFIKEVPGLERLSTAFKDKVEVAALLYQANAANADLRDMSSGFLTAMKLKSPIPAAVVDRAYVRTLEIPYFPGHFFVTSKGTLAYGRNGFLEEKDLEFIFTEMAKLAPAPEAPKTEPAPAPQEAPKADAPPPPAPPAPEKPEEK